MPSLVEALEHKYGPMCCTPTNNGTLSSEDSDASSSEADEGICVIYVPRRSPRVTVPSLLVLNDCDITTAGEKEALLDKCAQVEELDLAKNKLNYWSEVFAILQQMPRLKFVNLSFNQLSMPLKKAEVDLGSLRWDHLRNIVLNSTKIDWDSVQQILDLSPQLEELHLSLNDYNDVKLCESRLCTCQKDDQENRNNLHEDIAESVKCECPKVDYRKRHKHLGVKKLHFTDNPVGEWREVCKIGYAFPNLEALVVADCPIETLELLNDCCSDNECGKTTEECPHESFKLLKFLNLNATRLSAWDDVERLRQFPGLRCLRVQGCPIGGSEYTEHERRQLIIARLPNIEMLNGGFIEATEREAAERAFVRYYMEKPESEQPERYFELLNIHGKLVPLVNIDLRPEKRVKVTFTCGNNSEVRSVDVYRTVSDLKSKLEGFVGFSAAKMRLFYVDQDLDQDLRDFTGPEEMKYPHKQLYSYNIQSGDEIIIDCKKKPSESKP